MRKYCNYIFIHLASFSEAQMRLEMEIEQDFSKSRCPSFQSNM